ncbi:MAG: methylase, partial [Sphingopyxis sp.]|nr:methylase [Sphingopyxis sp.]
WSWKDAYEACEVAQGLFLRRYGPAIKARANNEPSRLLTMLSKIGALLPTQTRRSEESHSLQQFSTPLEFAYVASLAAGVGSNDVVLEPSAGTGMLAIFADLAGGKLVLNEWAETRAGLLQLLFPGAPVSRFDGAQIDDRLDADLRPSVVLMNPPFSSSPLIEGRHAAATFEHIRSALARLQPNGRLVAITGESFSPLSPAWRAGFERLQEKGRLVFTASLTRGFFARHGTQVESRLTVFDKTPAENPQAFRENFGPIATLEELLALVLREVPPRLAPTPRDRAGDESPAPSKSVASIAVPRSSHLRSLDGSFGSSSSRSSNVTLVETPASRPSTVAAEIIELTYETRDWKAPQGGPLGASLYEPYAVQSIVVTGAKPHPTTLVQSAAMASVAPPKPSYRPHLPKSVIESG